MSFTDTTKKWCGQNENTEKSSYYQMDTNK